MKNHALQASKRVGGGLLPPSTVLKLEADGHASLCRIPESGPRCGGRAQHLLRPDPVTNICEALTLGPWLLSALKNGAEHPLVALPRGSITGCKWENMHQQAWKSRNLCVFVCFLCICVLHVVCICVCVHVCAHACGVCVFRGMCVYTWMGCCVCWCVCVW